MKKVYVIQVAVSGTEFNHLYIHPQIYYDTYEEANFRMEQLVTKQLFPSEQLKVAPLWLIDKTPNDEDS